MTLAVDIRLDDQAAVAALGRLPNKIVEWRGQKLNEVADFVVKRAVAYAYENAKYSKTGRLAASIKKTVNAREGKATVIADRRVARYAPFVEFGQRPHAIPNNPMWGMRGKIHPGARGKLFMERAAVDAALVAPMKIREGVRLAVRDSGFKEFR